MGHWLAAFLDPSIRKQSVGVEGRLSPLVPVISGVPQGTVLGPCLFLVHLMGISSNISPETSASSFADDTRLQRGIADEKDCELLQEDLDKVCTWAEDIGMMFNAGNFFRMEVGVAKLLSVFLLTNQSFPSNESKTYINF